MRKIVFWLVVLAVILFPVTALEAAQNGRGGGGSGHSVSEGRSFGHSGGGGYRSGGGSHQRAPSTGHYRAPHYNRSLAPAHRAPAYRSYGGHSYPRYHFPFFAGIGFLGGYWVGSYYYSYPYNNLCRRFIPTGEYHLESQQDPSTGNFYQIEVPSGYWETVPCQP